MFGAVERPANTKPDIIVVVRGPASDMRIRQKTRMAGIWINSDRAILKGHAGLLLRREHAGR